MPAEWKPRMREVGIDPDGEGPLPDGEYHAEEACFAMAANYLGVRIDAEFMDESPFVFGV